VYDILIIDSGVDLSEPTKAVIKISDRILIVSTASHVSAQNNYRYKEDLIALGVDREKLLLFINMISDRKTAGDVVETIVCTFSETGAPIQTVAAVYYDEKVAQARECHGFCYNSHTTSFKKGIDQVLKKLGLAHQSFSQEPQVERPLAAKSIGRINRLRRVLVWNR
jgi:MinD-like ATPase involved in chromosome partitioning or flagellar assembly